MQQNPLNIHTKKKVLICRKNRERPNCSVHILWAITINSYSLPSEIEQQCTHI